MMTQPLTALVVEDEPISRELLRSMLGETGLIEVIGEANNVSEAIAAIAQEPPDVVFLDIQMPDGTGFDVIQALGGDRMPAVVFVTAYDEYAVKAFEVMALDYLMKPFDEERLEQCVRRVAARLGKSEPVSRSDLLTLLEDLRAQRLTEYADRLAVDAETHVEVIPTADIDWLEAKGKHVLVHTRTATYYMREGMASVSARLDPRHFIRVHRSVVVRMDRVKEIHRWLRGDYRLVLADGTKVVTGLTYKKAVESRLLGNRRPPIG